MKTESGSQISKSWTEGGGVAGEASGAWLLASGFGADVDETGLWLEARLLVASGFSGSSSPGSGIVVGGWSKAIVSEAPGNWLLASGLGTDRGEF